MSKTLKMVVIKLLVNKHNSVLKYYEITDQFKICFYFFIEILEKVVSTQLYVRNSSQFLDHFTALKWLHLGDTNDMGSHL